MKIKKYKVILTNRAQKDFENIQDYTYEKYGKKQVQTYSQIIIKGLKKLSTYPEFFGHSHNEVPNGYRVYKVGQHYLIFRIEDNIVYVVAILHERMNLSKRLEQHH